MNQGCLPNNAQARILPAALCWLFLLAVGIGLIGVSEYRAAANLHAGLAPQQLLSVSLAGYANLLLLGAAGLYVAHLRFAGGTVGRCASGMALAGALGLLAAMVVRGGEAYVMHRVVDVPLTSLHDMLSLFSAFAVVIYLVMERAYRTRAAGAFVMPVVAVAVLFDIWLSSNELAGFLGVNLLFSGLHAYG